MAVEKYVAKQHRMNKVDYIEAHRKVKKTLQEIEVSQNEKEFLAKLIAHRIEYKKYGQGMDFRKWLQIYLDRGFYEDSREGADASQTH